MTLDNELLTKALESFCKRLVEGHSINPTNQIWNEIDKPNQQALKQNFIGPLYVAIESYLEGEK